MLAVLPFLAAFVVSLAAAYLRIALRAWTVATAVAIIAVGYVAGASWLAIAIPLVVLALFAVPLNLVDFRRRKISAPALAAFQKVTPQLSATEQIALDAGTVGFEGELFSGKPDWSKLLKQPKPELSVEEQAFLDGPVEELCAMTNDWEITHELADLTPEIWDVHQDPQILRHDHSEEIWRTGIFSTCAIGGAAETDGCVRLAVVDGRRAEFARPGRVAAALRYAGTA